MADQGEAVLVDRSTVDQYFVTDSALAGVHAFARVDDNGVLAIDLRTVTREGVRSRALRGKEQFGRIMAHFAGKVRAIKGNWQFGTNLDEVNGLTAQGVSLEQAARQTWTGRRALEAGFTNIVVLRYDGHPGKYVAVQVHFERPNTNP